MMDLSSDGNGIATSGLFIFCDKLSERRREWPTPTMVNSQLHWNYFTLLWNLVKVTCASIFRINRLLALINLLIVSIIVLKSNNVFLTLSEDDVASVIGSWLSELAFRAITDSASHRPVICCLLLVSDIEATLRTLLLIFAWFTP